MNEWMNSYLERSKVKYERMSACLHEQRRGELVACKVFRTDVTPREDVARQREFKVMTELKHENIVKFISVEQEVWVSSSGAAL